MDELARQEKGLYPAIQQLMESRKYTVICQFKTFFPLTGRTRILDLLGFRWTDDGDLDAWAIEGKQGASPADTLTALGQAIEYQLYVPRVSVAAEVPREALAFAESPLRQLGLGYIHATQASATEIISSSHSPRCYQNEFNQVIRHAGVLCLLGRELWKAENRREHHSDQSDVDASTDAARSPFYCIHNNDPVQYMLSTSGKAKKVQLEIWIDRKPTLTSVYRHIEAERLAELLAELEATTTIFKFKRDTFGRLGNSLDQRQLPTEHTAIAEKLELARLWQDEARVVPVISVALELWGWDAMPRYAEANRAVEQTIERLKPIRDYLAATANQTRS